MSIHSSGPKCHGNKCGYNASSPARCRNVSNKYGTMLMVCLLDNVYLASCAHVCVYVVPLRVTVSHALRLSPVSGRNSPAETHCSMMSSPQRRAQKGKESKIGKLLYIYLHALSLRSPSKALCLPPELQWTTSHSRRASDSRLGVRGCNTYFNRCVLVWACAIFSVRTCPSNNSDQ